jgi:hypothetical protein
MQSVKDSEYGTLSVRSLVNQPIPPFEIAELDENKVLVKENGELPLTWNTPPSLP